MGAAAGSSGMTQISTMSPAGARDEATEADDGIVVRRELLALMLGASGAALTAHAVLALAVIGVLNVFGVQRGLSVWLAALVAPHAETVDRHEPMLTLDGLRLIWERNQEDGG